MNLPEFESTASLFRGTRAVTYSVMTAWLGTSHVVVQVDRLESLLARFNTAFNMT